MRCLPTFQRSVPRSSASPQCVNSYAECSLTLDYSLSVCNFLFVCVPQWLYGLYTQEPYPTRVNNPGPSPNYSHDPMVMAAQHAKEKAAWELNNKYFKEPRTMDSVLISRFISLFKENYEKGFMKPYIANPKMQF